MGAVGDLTRSSHDYVDNPFWSVFQIKVKQFQNKFAAPIGEKDEGKVLLFVNLTMDSSMREETNREIKELRRVAKKYGGDGETRDFGVYAQFSYDVRGGDDKTNKQIAQELIKMNLITKDSIAGNSIRFLEKVSSLFE